MVKKIIIVSLIITSLVGGGGTVYLVYHQPKKSVTKESSSPLLNNTSPQKLLANRIKVDLQKDLEKAKKSDKHFSKSWEKSLGESCSEYRGNDWRLWYNGETKTASGKEKRERGNIFSEALKPSDWNEISSLISQIDNLNEEKRKKSEREHQEERAKIDQKLKNNPNLFVYEFTDEIWGRSEDEVYHFFLGYQNSQKLHLKIRWNHPDSRNIFNKDRNFGYSEKHGHFFNIKGFENIPLQTYGHANDNSEFSKYVKETYPNYYKNIELTDKITIIAK